MGREQREWDRQIQAVKDGAMHQAVAHKATSIVGVAVDDERKRDYFEIVDDETWAEYLTFRVVPMNGKYIDVTRKGPDAKDL